MRQNKGIFQKGDGMTERTREEIDILQSLVNDPDNDNYTKSLYLAELRGYIRALEHTETITRDEKHRLLKGGKV